MRIRSRSIVSPSTTSIGLVIGTHSLLPGVSSAPVTNPSLPPPLLLPPLPSLPSSSSPPLPSLQDGSGQLDKNEYRACLLSLGYKLGADPVSSLSCALCTISLTPRDVPLQTNDPEFDKLWAEIDPNETGFVSFEAFLDFMTRQMVDQDTADQVLESFKVLAGDKVCSNVCTDCI